MDSELIARYKDDLKARQMRSARLYVFAIERFLAWLSPRNLALSQAVPAILNDYLLQRRDPKDRPNSIKSVIDRLRDFFKFAVAQKLITEDPTRDVSHLWLDIPGGLPAYDGVLRRIFSQPGDVLRFRLPLFAPYWERYLKHLLEKGYSQSSFHRITEHNSYFHRYLEGLGARCFRDASRQSLEAFLVTKQREYHAARGRPMPESYVAGMRARIEGFLTFGWRKAQGGSLDKRRMILKTPVSEALVDDYISFTRDHNGLSPTTIRGYLGNLQSLRRFLGRKGVADIAKIEIADLDEFMLYRSKSVTPRTLQSTATALRSFFGYLNLIGRIDRDLASAVLSPCRFSADLRPKYLPWKRIEEILAGVNRSTPAGKRDYAILILLACHGLRVREVRGLKVDDIDCEGRRMRLKHRKNGICEEIPMSERAAEALRDYKAVRRETPYNELFLTEHAPLGPLTGAGISGVAHRCLRGTLGGGYVFRHSFAKALLDRGAGLHEVGALLGHRKLRSSLIYTRIATEDMREVADNYGAWL